MATSSLFQKLLERKKPFTVDLVGELLDDGKPQAVMCRPLLPADYFAIEVGDNRSIPILTGKSSNEMSNKEKLEFYMYLQEVIMRSAFKIRDFQEGAESWRPIHWRKDGETPELTEDGGIALKPDDLAYNQNIATVGMAIINHTNFGGDMASYSDAGFSEGRLHSVREGGEDLREVAARGAADEE